MNRFVEQLLSATDPKKEQQSKPIPFSSLDQTDSIIILVHILLFVASHPAETRTQWVKNNSSRRWFLRIEEHRHAKRRSMPKTTTMIDRVSDTKVLCGNNLWSAARGAAGLHKML